MVSLESFTFVMSRIQCRKLNSRSKSILRQVLYTYFHQIEGVKFIYDSHGQTFLSTLYKIKCTECVAYAKILAILSLLHLCSPFAQSAFFSVFIFFFFFFNFFNYVGHSEIPLKNRQKMSFSLVTFARRTHQVILMQKDIASSSFQQLRTTLLVLRLSSITKVSLKCNKSFKI